MVITNYHAFRLRDEDSSNTTNQALRYGREGKPDTTETDGKMMQRVMKSLMSLKRIMAFNDEGHHCYREKPQDLKDTKLDADEKVEADRNNAAARLWINGLGAVGRQKNLTAVIDLSATPFFLQGSGYQEGTLFPWTVCDFSLMDAIESGIVKIPRVPVSDNASSDDTPVFRDLWEVVRDKMPQKGER